MTPTLWTQWTRRQTALILTIVTFGCAVVFLSVSMVHPKAIPNASLGADWQCSKTLFMTTCTKAASYRSHTPQRAPAANMLAAAVTR